ncbi:hypothetical protein [Zunongwangia sp.]|uniref:hypothetical protein n=1 Tax=Zunongwangia sp. TaxID=1965325 RepID=UPI003AA84615
MKFEEFIKKLGLALEDEDTAKALESFGIKPDQIEGFKDLAIPTNLDEALRIKGVQSDYDKRLGKAVQTREDNLKKKFNFVEKEEPDEEEEIETKDPAMKALLEEIKEMKKWRKEQEEAKQTETLEQKQQKAKDFLKSKGILPAYVHEMDLDKDFEEQFETVKTKFVEDGGTIATDPNPNPRQQRMPAPRNQDGAKKPSKEDIAKIVG